MNSMMEEEKGKREVLGYSVDLPTWRYEMLTGNHFIHTILVQAPIVFFLVSSGIRLVRAFHYE